MGVTETQASVAAWGRETFGTKDTTVGLAVRLNEEMAELLRAVALESEAAPVAVFQEIADVAILLYRLADRVGYTVAGAVDAKMAINRLRRWGSNGRHLPDGDDPGLDGTDFAHPAWWRGQHHACEVLARQVVATIEGRLVHEIEPVPWRDARERLERLVRGGP